METDSLTAVEAELLRQRIKSKKGKNFTRFAIKAVLQNPVYMVADEDAYNYFMEKEAEVCFPKESFADVDYGDFEEENSGLGKRKPSNTSKSRWREDSKLNLTG